MFEYHLSLVGLKKNTKKYLERICGLTLVVGTAQRAEILAVVTRAAFGHPNFPQFFAEL